MKPKLFAGSGGVSDEVLEDTRAGVLLCSHPGDMTQADAAKLSECRAMFTRERVVAG